MPRIGQYHRVSTEEQKLERQRETTSSYAIDTLGAELNDLHRYEDRSTGTNTNRQGYLDMMADVENDELDIVLVNSVSRISRSIRDLDRTVERIVDDNDCELHIIKEGIAVRQQEDDYTHGPAPLGFEKDDGHLVEAANFDEVVTVLEDVLADRLSKRKAAEQLGTTRTTIRASIDNRPELYGLA